MRCWFVNFWLMLPFLWFKQSLWMAPTKFHLSHSNKCNRIFVIQNQKRRWPNVRHARILCQPEHSILGNFMHRKISHVFMWKKNKNGAKRARNREKKAQAKMWQVATLITKLCAAKWNSGKSREYKGNVHTNIFVACSHHNSFVYPEYMSAWKTVCPSTAGQVTQYRCLAVRFVFISLCSVASVETNLQIKVN